MYVILDYPDILEVVIFTLKVQYLYSFLSTNTTPFRELHPLLNEDLDKFKTHLKESNKELVPLKVWQLQGI